MEIKCRAISGFGSIWFECFGRWSNAAAHVVCRNMGYTGGEAFGQAHFGPGTGPIFLDDVVCQGSESSLMDCAHGDWGEHDCSHWEDASVICESQYN